MYASPVAYGMAAVPQGWAHFFRWNPVGWMLEGTQGSYRGERLYTETPDGEIADEPIQRPSFVADPLLNELTSAWHGKPTTLPTLEDAARIVSLINTIERSAETGHVVRL